MLGRLLRKVVAVLSGIARDILRGMRIKYELRNRLSSRCTDLMTDLYTRPRDR